MSAERTDIVNLETFERLSVQTPLGRPAHVGF